MKLLFLIALTLWVKDVPFSHMEHERLPELNIPREAPSGRLGGPALSGESFQEPLLQEWTTENLHRP